MPDTTHNEQHVDPGSILGLPTEDDSKQMSEAEARLAGYRQFRHWVNAELEATLLAYRNEVWMDEDSVSAQDRHEEVLVLKRVRDQLNRLAPEG